MWRWINWLGIGWLLAGALGLGQGGFPASGAAPYLQAATATLPPLYIQAFEDVNVRAGPGTEYDMVGKLILGQTSPVLGQVVYGQIVWVQIEYIGGPNNTGWVWKDLVLLKGDLILAPILTPLPTPTRFPTTTPGPDTPQNTPTPDPNAGRLPTYTPPAAVARPTLLPDAGTTASRSFPSALIIISLVVLGGFGLLISFIRQRA